MGRKASFKTLAAIARRIKEGRGQGDWHDFMPWYRIKDVPSLGRRHRIFSVKFGRVIHLLSDLERNALYAAEYSLLISALKEQFPHLPLSRTRKIAAALGYKHPRAPGATIDHILTTDQLWFTSVKTKPVIQPVFVKYSADLLNARVQEKRKIEEESWANWDSSIPILPLKNFDEFSVTQTFVNNWDLIRDTLRPDYFDHFPKNLVARIDDYARSIANEGVATLDEISESTAARLRLPQAQVLTGIHYLLASLQWKVDLSTCPLSPFLPLKFL